MTQIKSVKFGEITIGSKTYYSDVVVWWNGKVEMKVKKHILTVNDFGDIFNKEPDVIVVGTGESAMVKLSPEVKSMAENKKIKFFVETTGKAVELFNAFEKSGKKVVAIIHTTC